MKWSKASGVILTVMAAGAVMASVGSATADAGTIPAGCTVISTTYYPQGTVIPNAAQLCTDQGGSVTPLTNTPNGYHLPSGYRSASDFTSDIYDAYVLNSNGAAVSDVYEQFEEVLSAGHTWKLYITNQWAYGAAFESSYDYYCGVNVSGSDLLAIRGAATAALRLINLAQSMPLARATTLKSFTQTTDQRLARSSQW